jgi:hypothetical protein
MTYFLVTSVIGSLIAFWFTGWTFRGVNNRLSRWLWFFVIRAVIMILAYLPLK